MALINSPYDSYNVTEVRSWFQAKNRFQIELAYGRIDRILSVRDVHLSENQSGGATVVPAPQADLNTNQFACFFKRHPSLPSPLETIMQIVAPKQTRRDRPPRLPGLCQLVLLDGAGEGFQPFDHL